MTPPLTPEQLEGLLERLRTMGSHGLKSYPTHFINPDGEEAADAIEALLARLRELESGLEPFAKAADDIEREYGERPAHQYQFPPLMMSDFTRARSALNRSTDNE